MKRHVRNISQRPEAAQISNLQIKLESTTTMIDQLLLVYRQQPWKAIGPTGNGSGNTTDTGTTNTNTEI